MVMAATEPNRLNGASTAPPPTEPLFDAASIKMQRLQRVNPLPMLNPGMLGIWLDQFEAGLLRMPAQLWDAMAKRDDTLITVKPQLENDIASKQWGVFTVEGADEKEAARHKACLEYFYNNLSARDAFDKNERGGRDKLIEQMMRADSFFYAVHHFVWKPQPGKTVNVEGGQPVPVITAELEYVPLWFFENTTGQLRFLRDGGFGVDGEELNWDGEWMVTTGRGLMFAASICYTFKRLTFQDWTIFNERYAQNKVVLTTPASQDSTQGRSAATVAENFNEDQALVFYEWAGATDKPPISLLGPEGTASVEIFEKFVERQDRKMSSMYRGNDLSMMSRGGKGEKPTGASLQGEEGESMEKGCCRRVAGTCQEFIDRQVIRLCFGEGVEPLAYFGLPDMDTVDTKDLRESAGFLADRGAQVKTSEIADRLGVELVTAAESTKAEDILQPLKTPSATGDTKSAEKQMTANSAADPDLETWLGEHRDNYRAAFGNDLRPLRSAFESVLQNEPGGELHGNLVRLRTELPNILPAIEKSGKDPASLQKIIRDAFERTTEGARS